MSTAESWKRRVEQQSRSGVSISEWCRRHGVRVNQFYYWHKRLCSVESAEGSERFVRVGVGNSEPVELLIGERLRVKIPATFDRPALKSLLEVLGC